ncbi:MAG: DUF3990 domain-containing protein [Solobacterium sp.]|nr:DUF3990 domain-containing protein [Solobacterium sp.]
MIVYHGSFMEIRNPDTTHSRKTVDFGQGFYVTPIYDQAKKWSEKFKHRGETAVVSSYQLDESQLKGFNIRSFESYSDEWLQFILECRKGIDVTDYDVVIGGVANDKVFNTVELFFDGLINAQEAISRLRYEHPNLQICFRSQLAIDSCLSFKEARIL